MYKKCIAANAANTNLSVNCEQLGTNSLLYYNNSESRGLVMILLKRVECGGQLSHLVIRYSLQH